MQDKLNLYINKLMRVVYSISEKPPEIQLNSVNPSASAHWSYFGNESFGDKKVDCAIWKDDEILITLWQFPGTQAFICKDIASARDTLKEALEWLTTNSESNEP